MRDIRGFLGCIRPKFQMCLYGLILCQYGETLNVIKIRTSATYMDDSKVEYTGQAMVLGERKGNKMKYKNIDRNILNDVVGRLSEDGKWYIRGASFPAWNEAHRPEFTLYRSVPTNSVVAHTQERVISRTDLFDFIEVAMGIKGVKNAKERVERYNHLTLEQILEVLDKPIKRTSAKQIRSQ